MAATDQTYRSQRILDIVFAVTCVLLLLSTVLMFSEDFFKEWKRDQNTFNDADETMDVLDGLNTVPNAEQVAAAQQAVDQAQQSIDKEALKKAQSRLDNALPQRVKKEAAYNNTKADYDSKMSILNIETDRDPNSARVAQLRQEVAQLGSELAQRNRDFEAAKSEYDDSLREVTAIKKPLSDATDQLNKLYKAADSYLKSAAKKRAGMGYRIRSLPILDAFARPTRIKQYVLDDLTIDYGTFKRVPRWDRCTTCHLGMERPDFTKENLRALAQLSPDSEQRLDQLKSMLKERKKALAASGEALQFDPGDLRLRPVELVHKDSKGEEDPKYINEFCVHPRLDLFVASDSPHPAEKFGCTICHGGQGSSTDFLLASHTPSTTEEKHRWERQRDWESWHFWDYPMLPKRFIESTCLKCHYEVTDLIQNGTHDSAPKVVSGYNLVRENGCFGCHEISGTKAGRRVGPDLRLEPSPPLEDLPIAEREKLTSDPANPPGTMRKIGPNLKRITEKSNEDWVRHWIDLPREFRPDTKMPHFYHLSNNDESVLKETAPDQATFPNTELQSIAHYLFFSSRGYLEEVTRRIILRATAPAIDQQAALPKGDATRGAQLFRERGCLACHTHQAAVKGSNDLPPIKSEAHFGPNLSRLRHKLGDGNADSKARHWLVQWIKDPKVYHPRTYMPVTHLDDQQAADVAEWLLSPEVNEPWKPQDLPAVSDESVEKLARVFLGKVRSPQGVEEMFSQDPKAQENTQKWLHGLAPDADEKLLQAGINRDTLMLYIGKKAIGQLGCYGCHEIHGFEGAKPIGTPLNDWGKKDPERLAFEDVDAFVKAHFKDIEEGKEHSYTADTAMPGAQKAELRPTDYEYYFFEALDHHQREGFLNQKLLEPRSYDYKRIRSWDERLRMPQFNFSRQTAGPSASAEEKARVAKAEAEAREQVMTFILGLVAEPVSTRYVYDPPPDRRNEIIGRQVIEKYNCIGCHLVQPGSYDFNEKSPDVQTALQKAYRAARTSFPSDHRFAGHTAWSGPLQTKPGRLTAHGVTRVEEDPDEGNKLLLTLTEALHVPGIGAGDAQAVKDGFANDLPAYTTLVVPQSKEKDMVLAHTDPLGGTFGDLLAGYLVAVDARKPQVQQIYKDTDTARPAVPPQLLREGEKVQPAWLFGFLKNPIKIRPMTVLRMPKFNMSDAEAMALVNYFAAVDKVHNRGLDLHYPYLAIPEREESYWEARNRDYVQRLGQKKLDERLKSLEDVWKADLAGLQMKDDKKGKQQIEEWQKEYRQNNVYAADAYRLVANYQICLGCHQVGNLQPTNRAAQGPALDLAYNRLRPDWTERWIANPQRFLTFKTPMPQNFGRNVENFQQFFDAPSIDQIQAARDMLMDMPRVVDLPANRSFRPKEEGGGGK